MGFAYVSLAALLLWLVQAAFIPRGHEFHAESRILIKDFLC